MADKEYVQVATPFFRAAFVETLTVPKKKEGSEDLFYGLSMLFPKQGLTMLDESTGTIVPATLDELKQVATAQAQKQWPQGVPPDVKSPFLDGDLKTWTGFPGTTYVRVMTKRVPGVVNREGTRVSDPEEIRALIYAGCWCRAVINPFSYVPRPDKPQKGIGFGLQSVQFFKNDEPFVMEHDPTDDYGALPDVDGVGLMPGAGGANGAAAPPAGTESIF